MNTKRLFIVPALALAGLASCSDGDEPSPAGGYPADNVVRFSVGVDLPKPETRGSHEDATTVSDFGIFIGNAANSTYSYDNVKVTGSSVTAWTPEKQMLWQDASAPVDITAYSPAVESGKIKENGFGEAGHTIKKFDFALPSVQTAEDRSCDLLAYGKAGFVPSKDLEDGKIPVAFRHLMSRVTVKLTFGSEFASGNPVSSVQIGGSYVKGSVILSTTDPELKGKLPLAEPNRSTKDNISSVTLYRTEASPADYCCLLIPQELEAGSNPLTVVIKAKGKTYTWTSPETVTLEGNTHYTLPLTVGKDKVIPGTISASEWGVADSRDLATE